MTGMNLEVGISVSLDSGETIWITSTTPYHIRVRASPTLCPNAVIHPHVCLVCVQLYTGNLTFMPWDEVYGMLQRLWVKREEHKADLRLKVYNRGDWRTGDPPACMSSCVTTETSREHAMPTGGGRLQGQGGVVLHVSHGCLWLLLCRLSRGVRQGGRVARGV
jgi:hypothetical protein